jgi:hypothetical protein
MKTMYRELQTVVGELLLMIQKADPSALDLQPENQQADLINILRSLNLSFLILLADDEHPSYHQARALLDAHFQTSNLAAFYLGGTRAIQQEIDALEDDAPAAARSLRSLAAQLGARGIPLSQDKFVEQLWSFFHPQAAGIRNHEQRRIADLRLKRTVNITHPNPSPLENPPRQVLFTANALLTLPSDSIPLSQQALSDDLQVQLTPVLAETQVYWYDHPIQVGVEPQNNELVYGLRGLQESLDFEIEHGSCLEGQQLTCLLSVSVTHDGLHDLAHQYLVEALQAGGPLPGLKIVMFTESDSRKLISEILAPAAEHYLNVADAQAQLRMLGVDGEYGRHYSFLKAMTALWQVLVDPQVKATFKIDLDQVFPQEQLIKETGMSAFQHLQSSLWGAEGVDVDGQPVELGMIAGALVNEDDIEAGLFTPDVPFPHAGKQLTLDERLFFSQLPQALSTRAEMMARYDTPMLDGTDSCLQRVHVTGGTNGILVESLRRHRPFTPSFIGRAEDQAYILSSYGEQGTRLAYLHQSGLIMRHDKQAFAQEAIQSAQVGKLVGDYVRILYFSAYARAIGADLNEIKNSLDPFTGSFISYIPTTLTLLRFALKAEALFQAGNSQLAVDFLNLGSQRISQALAFADHELQERYEVERQGWNLYYDTLLALENGINAGDPFAEALRLKAQDLIDRCTIQS